MRILFMGTPEYAAVSLRRLYEDGHEICGVFTQPDKPKNRGHKKMVSPVKLLAQEYGTPVYQPVTLRDEEAVRTVKALSPELIAVVAYGKILPREILDLPPLGCVNIHGSLLPKYRGGGADPMGGAPRRARHRCDGHLYVGRDGCRRYHWHETD